MSSSSGLPDTPVEDPVDLLRRDILLGVELVPERVQEQHELLELAFVGSFVHAVQARDLRALIMRFAASTFAAIMHSSMILCVTSRSTALTLLDLAALVELDLRFGHVEVDRAALLARGRERLVDGVQVLAAPA